MHGLRVELAGRERECAELASGLERAALGQGSVIVLVGEAGIGKSSLAGWAVARATEMGMTTAQGGCSAAGMPPLWPMRRALADLMPDLPWRDDGTATTGSDRDLLTAAVIEGVAASARDRPLFVVLEDLHWADSGTLRMLRAMADAVPALPILLLLTARDEPGETSLEIRTELGQLPTHARRIVVVPLDEAGIAALAKSVLGSALSDADIHELRGRTGGNPFFVTEVLRLQASHGQQAALVVPPGVSEVIQRRVARVSQPCAALLAEAAVAAETCENFIEVDVLPPDAAATLREAVDARLVEEAPGSLRFRHSLIRQVITAELSAQERARLHALIAARLEGRSDALDSPARMAHHWARAEGEHAAERAASWSLLAGRAAVAEFGFEAAVEHFRRSLTWAGTNRIPVSIELGEALQLCGDMDDARRILLAAAEQAERAGRPIDLARAALALGGGLAGFEVPIHEEQQSALLERADELLPESAHTWRSAVRARLSLAGAGIMTPQARVAMAEDALILARTARDTVIESAVLAAYCDAVAGPDFVHARIEAATRMLSLTESRGTLHARATVLLANRLLLVAHLENGNIGAAEIQALAYERTAGHLGVPRYDWLPEIWRGMRALLDDDVEAALQRADAAEEIGRRANSFNAELMVFTLRMQAHLERGTPDQFADAVRTLLDRLGGFGMPAMYIAAPARLLLAAGDSGAARSVLRAFVSGGPEAMPKDAEWLEAHWAMVDIAIELGDRVAAERLFHALHPYADLWAVDGIGGAVFGCVAEQLSRVAGYLGRTETAAAHAARAREHYEAQGTPALLRRLTRAPRRGTGRARIHQEGTTWHLEWQGRHTNVPDAKGLHDLAILLTRPGQPIPALDLVANRGGPPREWAGGDLGPVLDDAARAAYRKRLRDLERALEDAETDGDAERAERIREERSVLARELSASLGLGGRPRIAGDPADRARKAITMRIRAAIRAIESQDPALARHLTNAIRTGRLCSYEPETPVDWKI